MTRIFSALLAVALLAAPARADDQPWAAGVTEQQRATAKQLLDAGNALFLDRKYKEALEKYQDAVLAWDHPAIRFNIVRCLIQLDRPVEASDNLERALKYGAAPLDQTVFEEATGYQVLLAKEIGNLEVRCTQAGARVSLDGQSLIEACPGEQHQRVKPGPHQIVAVKDGYATKTIELIVVGGAHESVSPQLEPLAKVARIERRWAAWKPWLVFGGGLAVGGFGGVLHGFAVSQMNDFDRQVGALCANTGCEPGDPRTPKRPSTVENNTAVGMMAVGGTAAIAGAVLLYMNRSHTVYPSAIEKLQPTIAPISGGLTLQLRAEF